MIRRRRLSSRCMVYIYDLFYMFKGKIVSYAEMIITKVLHIAGKTRVNVIFDIRTPWPILSARAQEAGRAHVLNAVVTLKTTSTYFTRRPAIVFKESLVILLMFLSVVQCLCTTTFTRSRACVEWNSVSKGFFRFSSVDVSDIGLFMYICVGLG